MRGANFTINTRPATWTTDREQDVWDCRPSPLTTGSGDFLAADNVTATYSRARGRDGAGRPVSHYGYAEPRGSVDQLQHHQCGCGLHDQHAAGDMDDRRQQQDYGNADPAPDTGSGDFLAADNVTATYSRAPGETVPGGPYHITATLSPAAVLTNYSITNAGADFTINTRPATWTTNSEQDVRGLRPGPLTTGSGDFLAADGVTATYSRAPGETVLGGPYHITATLSPRQC